MGIFAQPRRTLAAFAVGLLGILAIALAASAAGARKADRLTTLEGTIWVANRGAHTIRGFDAATGSVVAHGCDGAPALSPATSRTHAAGSMSPRSSARRPRSRSSIPTRASSRSGSSSHPGSRPHHVHTSPGGDLVAFGLYGTDTVAVVDTARTRCSAPGTPTRLSTIGREPRRCLLEGRTDPVRRERRDRRGRSRSSRGPAKCSGGWTCPERTSSPCRRTARRPS